MLLSTLEYENSGREILCFKQMYKMGGKKLEHPVFLYGILWAGFQAGKLGDKLCYVNQNQDMIQAFEKECVNFAMVAKNFGNDLSNNLVDLELWLHKLYLCEEMFKLPF